MDDKLNLEQREASESGARHVLVLAGAGTGKTRTIIARARFLIESGVSESRILILSFTRKSALEIVERIRAELPKSGQKRLQGKTFHSWCSEIIRNNPEIFSQANYTLLSEDDVQSCFQYLISQQPKGTISHLIRADQIASIYSYATNTRVSLSDAMRMKLQHQTRTRLSVDDLMVQLKPVCEEIIKGYMRYKKERQYIDYDDVLKIVANGLHSNLEAQEYIATQYDHILIDEMQDTNPLQYALLSNFMPWCHLFCVGDDAQSIYGFRGADFKSIHHFKDLVPEAAVYRLTLNYRSTQKILDLSNWLLNQSPLRYDKNLKAVRGEGAAPTLVHFNSSEEEANLVTDCMIQSVLEQGMKWRDHMVLARGKFGLKHIEGRCIKKAIPYILVGGISLLRSKHICDVLSALRIVANPHDELAWMRYLQLWRGVGVVSAQRMVGLCLSCDSLERMLEALRGQKVACALYETLLECSRWVHAPGKAVEQALKCLEPTLCNLFKNEWAARKEDFPILVDIASGCDSLTELVNEYMMDPKLMEMIKNPDGSNDDRVLLTTIHSAKGLEAPICHIVDVDPESWPNKRAMEEGTESVEEERRCLYVAMTRACDSLYLYRDVRSVRAQGRAKAWSKKIPEHVRARLEQKKFRKESPSYFLNALPQALVVSVLPKDDKPSKGSGYRGRPVKDADEFDFS